MAERRVERERAVESRQPWWETPRGRRLTELCAEEWRRQLIERGRQPGAPQREGAA